jgi:hypothetical protein
VHAQVDQPRRQHPTLEIDHPGTVGNRILRVADALDHSVSDQHRRPIAYSATGRVKPPSPVSQTRPFVLGGAASRDGSRCGIAAA